MRSKSSQQFRLAQGGHIDRSGPLTFKFDGRTLSGFKGDTLASALLANGVHLVGRSFKYHRPRGILSAGPEEPNALVQLGQGDEADPNLPATMIELFDGLVASSQNRWPNLSFDALTINQLVSPLIPAGFYYKTFKWPAAFWKPLYERLIRRAAGIGKVNPAPDRDNYEERYAHCDVLIVGAGPTGLAAALSAARSGARVVLCEQQPVLGGTLNSTLLTINDTSANRWAGAIADELDSLTNVRVLRRTTVFGYYDHNMLGALERRTHHGLPGQTQEARQVYWRIRAKSVVLATGAFERPLLFANNDRPGVMLSAAVRSYVNFFGVRPGSRAIVATNNDDAYRTALDLQSAGVAVAAVVDCRNAGGEQLTRSVRSAGIEILTDHRILKASGRSRVTGVTVESKAGTYVLSCDLLAVSGGWDPAIHLYCHAGGKPVYSEKISAFVAGKAAQAELVAGTANGKFDLSQCIKEGLNSGGRAAAACGFAAAEIELPVTDDNAEYTVPSVVERAASNARRGKLFVDLQGDVTTRDIRIAVSEGYDSAELLKRYTTQGMWTDQGKSGNVNALALLAFNRNEKIGNAGTTHFRPPFSPVAISAFAGPRTGLHARPQRLGPLHDLHVAQGAVMSNAGLWKSPNTYPRDGESHFDSVKREVLGVRASVGIADTSTLGKIMLYGAADIPEFLNRVYCNEWNTLRRGRAQYGLMLREDGIVFDDGTTTRLENESYFMTTSTARSGSVLSHLEFCLQSLWPELAVGLTDVTDQWAVLNLAGPNSRNVLQQVLEQDLSNEVIPYLGVKEVEFCGVPIRLIRLGYSGELSYEIYVPAGYAADLWSKILEAGKPYGITRFGARAMTVMRCEAGHVSGPEIDGRTTARDLGMARLMSEKKDYIGRYMAQRPAFTSRLRPTLVGFVPADRRTPLRAGAQITEPSNLTAATSSLGYISTAVFSPTLGHHIGLGFLAGGLEHKGEIFQAAFPLKEESVPVEIVPTPFVDPEGIRARA